MVGGRNQQQEPLDTVEMFDTWHGCWRQCPPITTPRAGCAAAALADGRLLVTGGYDRRGTVNGLLDTCEVFDPNKQSWSSSCAPLLRGRWGHGSALFGGRVFVVGGCALQPNSSPGDAFMETMRHCESYDPKQNSWAPLPPLCVARAGARLVSLGSSSNSCASRLAAIGGCEDVFGRGEMLARVEIFDATLGCWCLLRSRLTVPRTCAGVAALDEQQVLVLGGAPSLNSAEVFSTFDGNNVEDGRAGVQRAHAAAADGPEVALASGQGRMGCQAVTMRLPERGGSYPLVRRECVVVVGGENGYEDGQFRPEASIFKTVLVYDIEAKKWTDESTHGLPPLLAARTAMAACLAPGRPTSYPR